MSDDDLVGMENIAYQYEELPISDLPAERGSMPGKIHKELKETKLISGRGCVP